MITMMTMTLIVQFIKLEDDEYSMKEFAGFLYKFGLTF